MALFMGVWYFPHDGHNIFVLTFLLPETRTTFYKKAE